MDRLNKLRDYFVGILSENGWVTSHESYFLMGVILLAVALAFVHSVIFPTVNSSNRSDSPWVIAQNLVQNKGLTACNNDYFPFCKTSDQQTAMRGPVPILLFAAAMWIFPSPFSGILVETLLYLGTLLVIVAVLKKFDNRAAQLGALIWAIDLPVLRQMADDHGEMSAALFISIGMLFFQNGITDRRMRNWVLSGLSFGVAALCLPVFLGVAIGMGVGIALLLTLKPDGNRSILKRLKPALGFTLATVFVIVPWVVRNQMAFGRPVLGTTLIGYNLYRHNSIVEASNFQPHYVGPAEAALEIEKLIANSRLTGPKNEAQMDSFYFNNGLHIILQHPANYIKLSLYRFLPLWFDTGVKAAYGQPSDPLDNLIFFMQLVLLVAIAIGIVRMRGRIWPYLLAAALFCGAYMAVDSQQSYLVGIMPMLIIMASFSPFDWRSSAPFLP
jgi:hypothetical protein